jgi:hypothetical protein
VEVRAVQALVVVLDDQLPVRLHVVDDPMPATELLHLPRTELVREIRQLGGQRRGRTGHVEKDVAVPHVGVDLA